MSRKENSLDNGLMEYFFGITKSKMFYSQEKNENIAELKKRIKIKLKGLTPAEYRNQSLN